MTVHPQSLFLALAGLHLLDAPRPLSGTSIVIVMGRLGVGKSAARSVVQRMAAKGFIARHREGRKTYYSLTDQGRSVLREGQQKMFAGWRPEEWDGCWTVIRVQVPESRRTLRHQISSRLSWAGFGQADGSTWVAPGPYEVAAILGPEGAEVAPIVVYGTPQPPTTDAMLVAAFDLDDRARAYAAFGEKWQPAELPSVPMESLVKRVELHFDWLTLTRTDPQLPTALLPENWPGARQRELFRDMDRQLGEGEAPVVGDFFAGEL